MAQKNHATSGQKKTQPLGNKKNHATPPHKISEKSVKSGYQSNQGNQSNQGDQGDQGSLNQSGQSKPIWAI